MLCLNKITKILYVQTFVNVDSFLSFYFPVDLFNPFAKY